uniref:FISNA domain-containing protein n=1 Tax=Pygocentrus nattereri TaxID=42514 RepID=A0AAR2IQJ4_PYGNA
MDLWPETLYTSMNLVISLHEYAMKSSPACHRKLKSTLKERFQKINEGIPKHGNSTLLHDIYTELYITEGGDGEINNEHEVRQIETACRRPATQETLINCNDIFREKSIRTVLTKGVAGIGKTVSVQKFILDWAEGKANQDILFIFPLPFRELNLMKNERISLEDLLHQFFKVRGFNDSQKEEYFRKRISDQNLVNKIITHMKTSRSLYIMCHIPVFCWIAATVLEGIFGKEHSEKMPKTLTQMFTHFLIFQIKQNSQNAVDKALHSETGHLDLFLRFLLGLSLESSQTLLQGLLPKTGSRSHSNDETIEYIKEKIRNDLSPEKSINFFHCLNELNDHSLVQEVQKYLNRKSDSCLSGAKLSPAQWSALVFVLLNSEEELNEFDLRKYESSEECLKRLLPVVKASFKAFSENSSLRELDLSDNELQNSGVKLLSTGLENSHCKLEILSEPGESGVELLSDLLKDPHCKLEKLQ